MWRNVVFAITLWVALFAVWLYSGEQFLDLVFAIPDAGPVDDIILTAVIAAEDWRATLDLPDYFAALRATLHETFGLG